MISVLKYSRSKLLARWINIFIGFIIMVKILQELFRWYPIRRVRIVFQKNMDYEINLYVRPTFYSNGLFFIALWNWIRSSENVSMKQNGSKHVKLEFILVSR